MNIVSLRFLLVSGSVAALASGCGHKADAKSELEKTASLIASSETAQPSAPATPEPQPAPTGGAVLEPYVPDAPPAQTVKQAITAYNAHEYEDAVVRLQKLRASTALTAEQRMALQDSMAAVMAEIYALAEKGDQRAVAAVKAYEAMQTMRH